MKLECDPIRTWEDHAVDFQIKLISKLSKVIYDKK